SIALFAAATAAMALLRPPFPLLLFFYAIAGLVGVGQNPTAYSKVLASYFDDNRGLAMGLALAGVGVGTALMPSLSNVLIAHFGWRIGYLGLALTIVILALIPVAAWLPEPVPAQAGSVQASKGTPDLPGLGFGDAIRTFRYWALALSFF